MILTALALTRAGTIGPLAAWVEASGGSVARLFRAADLPLEIIEQPDRLILLRDQFRLVEAAARELGDDALPARLSTAAGLDGLGLYGRHMLSFERLGDAISIAYQAYGSLLQASTEMELEICGGWARWSYLITAPLTHGRQKNELLAFGYMLDFLRRFLGPHWTPNRIELPGLVQGRSRIETLFGCNLTAGDRAAIVFPAELLDARNPTPVAARGALPAIVPDISDTTDIVPAHDRARPPHRRGRHRGDRQSDGDDAADPATAAGGGRHQLCGPIAAAEGSRGARCAPAT
jgi:hypothetical protein